MAFNLLKYFQKPEIIQEGGVKASTNEITSSQSPYFKDSYFRPYNADLLYRKKGNYDIYDDMREDDAIKSILMTKKYLMLGSGWTIDIDDEDDEQQHEIKEFIEKALEQDIDIDFNKSMLEMLTAMDYGVSFSEIIWKLEDGKYKIKYIKTRSPHAWLIHQDVQGNIEKLEQRAQAGSIIIDDLTNMVVFPYQMEFDNYYGKCFSDDTEILTLDGWKYFTDISKDDEFATLNPKKYNQLEYHKANKLFSYDYKGKMFHQGGKAIDLLVTPNHKMWVKTQNTDDYRFIYADRLPRHISYKRDVVWHGSDPMFIKVGEKIIETDKFLRFLGVFIAEGCTYRNIVNKKNGKRYSYPYVAISQKRGEKLETIKQWVSDCGFEYYENKNNKTGISTLIIRNDIGLYNYLEKFGKGARNKRITKEIKALSSNNLSILYDAMSFGDGTRDGAEYFTASKKLADDVSEILFKAGFVATVSKRKMTNSFKTDQNYIWVVYKSIPSIHGESPNKIDKRSWVDYNGKVYCINVPNHLVYVRRNGKACWSGNSDLRSAYRAWWSKDFIIKAWNIYLDRFGMPLAIGKFDANVTSAEDQTKLQTIMDRIQTKTSITIPKDLEIEFLEATRAGEAGYEAAMNNYNLQIARSMLMPDLLGMAGDKTSGGSFALGQTQYDMFLKTLEWTRHELQRYIQRKIIDPLVKYNFAVEDIPQFKFKAMSESVKLDSLKIFIELLKTGKYKPNLEQINWANNIIGSPLTTEDDMPKIPEQLLGPDGQPIQPKLGPDGKPIEPKLDENGEPIEQEEQELDENGKPIEAKLDEEGNPIEEENEEDDDSESEEKIEKDMPMENPEDDEEEKKKKVKEKKMAKGLSREPIMAEKKQDFAKVNEDQLNTIELYSRQASATIATMQEVLLETIKKGRWIENKKLDKVANLELKYTDRLRVDIQSGMREMFNMGKRDAKFELKQPEKYAMDDSEEIYDQVVKNAPMLAATSITDDIVKKVKLTLSTGITQGLAQGEIIKQIKQIFEPYLYSIDGALLETTIRTNFATAYNQSKLAYFAPAVNNGDIYGYQYSAILDDRTTDICQSLNGKIFRADAVQDIEPPLHYNCRSTLIPILKDEIEQGKIFGASEQENAQFFDENGRFIESVKDLGDYEMRPGGFYVAKK